MTKPIKYCVLVVEDPDKGVSHEVNFEDDTLIRKDDQRIFSVGFNPKAYQIKSVTRINHVETPNVLYDYRLFAVRVS